MTAVNPNVAAPRYAIYYAPSPDSGWWAFGCAWLGRDPLYGRTIDQPLVAGVAPDLLSELTADPRTYGFHATLKPPFFLAPGHTVAELCASVGVLARSQSPFALGRLAVRTLGGSDNGGSAGFIALTTEDEPAELSLLAQACVEELDFYRAVPAAAELARRRKALLTPRQDELLLRLGYPYVLDQWRFHMSLTGRLPKRHAGPLMAWLLPAITALNAEPLRVDALCVYEQPAPGAPFRILGRFGFDGSEREPAADVP